MAFRVARVDVGSTKPLPRNTDNVEGFGMRLRVDAQQTAADGRQNEVTPLL